MQTYFHARLRPALNSFRYGAAYLYIPLDELGKKRRGLLSIDGRIWFGVRTRDYGDGQSAKAWIANVLEEWRVPEADGEVVLITMPRIFGYALQSSKFLAVQGSERRFARGAAEVSNTFGERHCYLCFREDRGAITPQDTVTAQKIFHVSPFLETKGDYSFRFSVGDGQLAIMIDLSDENGPLLRTSLAGTLVPATNGRLLRALARQSAIAVQDHCLDPLSSRETLF
ncbi:MAG: DUF1365 domain-containing protein [Rhizomicrobium sp.]